MAEYYSNSISRKKRGKSRVYSGKTLALFLLDTVVSLAMVLLVFSTVATIVCQYISPEKIIIENETECCEKNTEASAQSGHIDVDLGMKYCGDSKDMYLEILTVYCEMHDELKADLDKALAADNWKNYTVNIHSLKSNSLNVGASALSKMCLELEKAGKAISAGEDSDANTDLIRTKHPGVMAAYAEAVAEAKNILNKGIQ